MISTFFLRPLSPRLPGRGIAAGLCLALSACGGLPTNRLLTPVHQPVVTHDTYALDLAVGPHGLAPGEAERLKAWFAGVRLRYGDHIALDAPQGGQEAGSAVAGMVAAYGLLPPRPVAPDQAGAPPGTLRVIVARAHADVPGCPDWSANGENNLRNATSTNFGCAVNGNLAAMVADPDHLLRGARDAGQTDILAATRAIEAYRAAKPSGDGGTTVKKVNTQVSGGTY